MNGNHLYSIIGIFIGMILLFTIINPIASATDIPPNGVLIPKKTTCYTDSGTYLTNVISRACDNNSATDYISAIRNAPITVIFPIADNYAPSRLQVVDGSTHNVDVFYFNNDLGVWVTDGSFTSDSQTNDTFLLTYFLRTSAIKIIFKAGAPGQAYLDLFEVWFYGSSIPSSPTISTLTDVNILTIAAFIFTFAFSFAFGEKKHPGFLAFSGVIGLSFAYTLYALINSIIITGVIAGISIMLIVFGFTQRKKEY